MKFAEVKKGLDKDATYFWQKRDDRYALINAFTLKTATGTTLRLDAMKLTKALTEAGYKIAKLEESF